MAHILVITHDDTWTENAGQISGREHRVDVVPHGLEALARLADERYDAVLMQVCAPMQEGLALARIVRDAPRQAKAVLVALVDDLGSAELSALRNAGVDHTLPSDCSLERIRSLVLNTLTPDERVYGPLAVLERALLMPVLA